MAIFEWDEQYSTGIPSIDKQHQELFQAVRRLNEAFKAGRGLQEVGQVLAFLSTYTREHFEAEEAYMAKIRFPDQLSHRLEHRVMTRKVEEFQQRYQFSDPTMGMATSLFLYEWLRDHILQKDFAYINHARETGQY
jgi:hemerythrin